MAGMAIPILENMTMAIARLAHTCSTDSKEESYNIHV